MKWKSDEKPEAKLGDWKNEKKFMWWGYAYSFEGKDKIRYRVLCDFIFIPRVFEHLTSLVSGFVSWNYLDEYLSIEDAAEAVDLEFKKHPERCGK